MRSFPSFGRTLFILAATAGALLAQQSAPPAAPQPGGEPAKEISEVGQRKLRKLARTARQPRLYKNGVEQHPNLAPPAPVEQKPEQRWLPGYRPTTPAAIIAYENWQREQNGMAPVQSGVRAPATTGKKSGRVQADGKPGNATPPGTTFQSATGECKPTPPLAVTSAPASQPAEGAPACNENGPIGNRHREIPIGRQTPAATEPAVPILAMNYSDPSGTIQPAVRDVSRMKVVAMCNQG